MSCCVCEFGHRQVFLTHALLMYRWTHVCLLDGSVWPITLPVVYCCQVWQWAWRRHHSQVTERTENEEDQQGDVIAHTNSSPSTTGMQDPLVLYDDMWGFIRAIIDCEGARVWKWLTEWSVILSEGSVWGRRAWEKGDGAGMGGNCLEEGNERVDEGCGGLWWGEQTGYLLPVCPCIVSWVP